MLDREDAELAVRAVAQIDYVRKAMAPMTLISLVLVLAILVVGVVSASTVLIVVGGVGLGCGAVLDLLSRRQRHLYQKSAAATRRVHDMNHPLSG